MAEVVTEALRGLDSGGGGWVPSGTHSPAPPLVLEFRPLTPAVEDDAPTRGLSIAVKGEAHPSPKLHFNLQK